MKVTIIGTNGFLSTIMALYCNKHGWNLQMYGIEEPKNNKADKFTLINLINETINPLELLDSDIIVYAAGAGIQSNLKEGSDLIYGLNVFAPVKLCNDLIKADYKGVFVSFGSVFEMGNTIIDHPFSESELLESNAEVPNDYCISKRMFTTFIKSYKPPFTHWHFIIPTIYGERENPKRLIPYTVNAIKNGEKYGFTSGNQTRQYIYVDEIPIIISKSYNIHLPTGIYNIGGTETLSVRELVILIHTVLGKDIPQGCFGIAERADNSMKYLALDGKKLYSAIDYTPNPSLVTNIIKYWNAIN